MMISVGMAIGIRGVIGRGESDGCNIPLHRGRGRTFESIIIILLVITKPSVPEPRKQKIKFNGACCGCKGRKRGAPGGVTPRHSPKWIRQVGSGEERRRHRIL